MKSILSLNLLLPYHYDTTKSNVSVTLRLTAESSSLIKYVTDLTLFINIQYVIFFNINLMNIYFQGIF